MLKTKRFAFIDALKGVLILFVLFHHALCLTLRIEHPYLSELFNLTAMPTFFFVSGYLNCTRQINSFTDLLNSFIKIFQRLVLPTFSCALIYIAIHNSILSNTHWSFYDVITDANWQGYWFTPTLFSISLLLIGLRFFSQKIFTGINLFILILSPIVAHFVWHELGPISNCFCIRKMLEYIPCYSLGVIAGNFRESMSVYFNKQYLWLVLMPVCIIYFVYVNLFRAENYILSCYIRQIFAFFVFALFQKTSKFWDQESHFVKSVRFIGQSSLCIYLLHYFFLPRNVQNFIQPLRIYIENNIAFQIVIGGAMALVLLAIVLMLAKILRRSRITSIAFLGENIAKD